MQRSVGIILYRIKNNVRAYLLLKYPHNPEYWGFSKGIIENNESEKEAALR